MADSGEAINKICSRIKKNLAGTIVVKRTTGVNDREIERLFLLSY